MRRAASSANFSPALPPPDRKLIRVGSCINWLSVAALPLVAELPLAFLRPLLVLQLVMWAFGQFITNLPSNAIVMARVSGKDLSNGAIINDFLLVRDRRGGGDYRRDTAQTPQLRTQIVTD